MKHIYILLFLLTNITVFSSNTYYKVRSGDTLYSIAKRYKTTVKELKNINFLNSNIIKIGEKLVVAKNKTSTTNKTPELIHKVKRGETLYRISQIYNVPIGKLTAINNIKGSQIYIGQKIYINRNGNETYIVQKGDSLLKIAKTYNTTVSDIKKENRLTSNIIHIGDKLYFNNMSVTSNKADPYNYQWPIKYTGITSPFGYRFHPIRKINVLHSGVDLRAGIGTKLYAPADGKVISAGWMGAYGKIVIIKHANGYETRLAHLSKIFVKRGELIKKGQFIGETGKTGGVTGPHLHYEIRKNNKPLNPIEYKH